MNKSTLQQINTLVAIAEKYLAVLNPVDDGSFKVSVEPREYGLCSLFLIDWELVRPTVKKLFDDTVCKLKELGYEDSNLKIRGE